MIKNICFIVNENLYESKRYFINRLAEACVRAGVEPFIFDTKSEGVLQAEEVARLQRRAPDLTCSFNNILPLRGGEYIWDHLKIPHYTYLVDTPLYWIHLARSPYSILSCIDKDDLEVLECLHFDRKFFLPHAVEKERVEGPMPRDERPYEVVMIGSCYDHESMRVAWKKKFSKEICRIIDDAIDLCFSSPKSTFAHAVQETWRDSGMDYQGVDFEQICECVDMYTRGKDRVELIRSIKDVPVHVFGKLFWQEGSHMREWSDYLGDCKNVVLHDPVMYGEVFDLLSKSKICLNSTPSIRNGSHERYFNGLAMGATVLGSINLYMREQFGDHRGVHEYHFKAWDRINDQVLGILSDEQKRLGEVEEGRKIIAARHTWDSRVDMLLKTMPLMIAKVNALTAARN